MPKVSPLQSDFSGGEVSPLFFGRVDAPAYKKALKTCLNYLPTLQGPLIRRPGEMYVFATKDNGIARLHPFEFSLTQAYMIEFGNNYIRFYKDNANITLPSQSVLGVNLGGANPKINVTAHGYTTGDRVIHEGVGGSTQINNLEFSIVVNDANHYTLNGILSSAVDSYTSGGTVSKIYEISSTYTSAEVFDLRFTQSNDVLYIVHPNHKPAKLIRYGHTDWQLNNLDLQDGPYLTPNSSQTTLTPSAATGTGITIAVGPNIAISNAADNGSGAIRITTATPHGFVSGDSIYITGVTGTTEANGVWTIQVIDSVTFDLRNSTFTNAYIAGGTASPALFSVTDVGRLIRMKEGSTWGYVIITAFTSPISVTADVLATLTNTSPKQFWRLGTYSDTTGYPAVITFHEDRLFLAATNSNPQEIDGSVIGQYENFQPTQLNGSVQPDNAVQFTFNSNDVNSVRWLKSDERGLLTGTVAGEWWVSPSTLGEALTPDNINAHKSTSYGSEFVDPVQAGKATVYVQRAGKRFREFAYFFDAGGFRSTDITQVAEHISPVGIKQMAYQKEPQSFIWSVRNDGVLATATYDRDLDALRTGWSRHVLGGVSDAAGSAAIVESIAVLPSSDTLRQDVWLIIKRYINGQVVRHVSYITKLFDRTDKQQDAFFVDAGLTYDAPVDITAITNANPMVITAPSHGLLVGDKILIEDILGMDELNNQTGFVNTVPTGNTFTAKDVQGNIINSTSFKPYVSNGTVRKMVTTISSINHLEGEVVIPLTDGAVHPPLTVTRGKIVLTYPAAVVQIGYTYNSDGEMLRLEAGSADGTALGKTRRTHRVGMLLEQTLGLKVGFNFDALDVVTFRTSANPLSRAVPLFTGIETFTVDADYDFENNFCFRQDQPLPGTIQAVMPQMITQDRG